jgi:dihydrofolate reductase
MFVFGSANLSKTLMNEGLFDEYRLGIAPVIHGRGRLLFDGGVAPQELQLLEMRPLSTGCVIFRYQIERLEWTIHSEQKCLISRSAR